MESHQGRVDDISIFGQESNQTTWRLAKMNLTIRGIDATNVVWNNEGSFLKDAHADLRSDYILANPPFNVSDWSGDLLRATDAGFTERRPQETPTLRGCSILFTTSSPTDARA